MSRYLKLKRDIVMPALKKILPLAAPAALLLFSTAAFAAPTAPGCDTLAGGFSPVIPCYNAELAEAPLDYHFIGKETLTDVELSHYHLMSQSWSPAGMVLPAEWLHDVDIYVPENPLTQRAVVIINNGTNKPAAGKPPGVPSDMTPEKLASLARNTRTIIVSISDVPNQLLTYSDDQRARAEDDSVAHSWSLFMQAPEALPRMPLHVPMAAAVSQAMSLAERELWQWKIDKFIVSGSSKRGWATWLTAIADKRVDAIAPLVIDLLGIHSAMNHMYHSYGGNWPLAFNPYYQEGIDTRVDTPEFASLLQIEDPLAYLNTEYGERLSIPKYIINASGDDFYVPDNSRFYFDRLPGMKSLRYAPNTGHAGIRNYAEQSLTTFIKRLQQGSALPEVTSAVQDGQLNVTFSEMPASVKMWQAVNPQARDFRFACDITYQPSVLPASDKLNLTLPSQEQGWQATFVEATFSDGYVATTPVYITPDDKFPTVAPPNKGPACNTLPGRGLGA